MPQKRVQFTDNSLNTHGFRTLTEGAVLDTFLKNPVMLYKHEEDLPPIGRWDDVKIENGIISGIPVFDEEDERAKSIKSKWDKGFLNAVSIGFEIIEKSEDQHLMLSGQTRPTITKWRLREVSIVPFPANTNSFKLYDQSNVINLHDIPSGIEQLSSILPEITHTINMEKIALRLGLNKDATETEILSAIDNIETLAAKKGLSSDFVLNHGRQIGLITEENEATYKRLAEKDPEGTFELITLSHQNQGAQSANMESRNSQAGSKDDRPVLLSELTKYMQGGKKEGDAKDSWTIIDWQKKDAKGLLEMKRNDPEKYQKLYDAYYKTTTA